MEPERRDSDGRIDGDHGAITNTVKPLPGRCNQPTRSGRPCRNTVGPGRQCPVHRRAGKTVTADEATAVTVARSGRRGRRLALLLIAFGVAVVLLLAVARPLPRGQFSQVLHHPYQSEIDQALAWQEQQPERAIALLEKTIQQARSERRGDNTMLAVLYDQLGKLHESRWHLLAGLNARRIAESLAPEPERQRHIAELQRAQREMEVEHRLEREYVAGRNSGPAQSLTGTVVVADIYLETGIGSDWGNKKRLLARRASQQLETWLTAQAERWQASKPEVINREFSASVKLAERTTGLAFLNAGTLDAVLLQLGHRDIGSFIEELARPANADQVAIVLHVPVSRRSYAHRCHGSPQLPAQLARNASTALTCIEEYAVVASRIEHNDWAQFSHTKAHELLHLFGADDLYNKAGGENYLATDIMHYPTRRLTDAQIGQITAWAIGWPAEKPDAPFPIID